MDTMPISTATHRSRGTDSYMIHIQGLPAQWSWQTLKDAIRPKASHGLWADVNQGRTPEEGNVGIVRLLGRKDADALFEYIIGELFANDVVFVHLFDLSQPGQANYLRCNCRSPFIQSTGATFSGICPGSGQHAPHPQYPPPTWSAGAGQVMPFDMPPARPLYMGYQPEPQVFYMAPPYYHAPMPGFAGSHYPDHGYNLYPDPRAWYAPAAHLPETSMGSDPGIRQGEEPHTTEGNSPQDIPLNTLAALLATGNVPEDPVVASGSGQPGLPRLRSTVSLDESLLSSRAEEDET